MSYKYTSSDPIDSEYSYKPWAEKTLYKLVLDEDQMKFRDSILDDDNLIIFCNAKAGTGKTLIATACADLLCELKKYKGIVYIASPTQEQKQGYLKGTLEEKSEPYFAPFYDALYKLKINNASLMSDIMNSKNGTAYIQCMTHTFQRGTNLENKVVIIDEAQNFYTDELRKVLTRIHDNCKVIVIGHTGQIDLYKNSDNSGFARYLEWFRGLHHVAVCNLTINHRGWISTHADDLPEDYNPE